MKAVKDKAMLKLKTKAYGPDDFIAGINHAVKTSLQLNFSFLFIADIQKIGKESSISLTQKLNEPSCFLRLRNCRTTHLTNRVTVHLSRISSLLEKLHPMYSPSCFNLLLPLPFPSPPVPCIGD